MEEWEAAEVGPGLSRPPLPAPAESGFVKGWIRQTILKYFLNKRPRAYIAFALNESYSNDDLSAAGPLHPPTTMLSPLQIWIIMVNSKSDADTL